MIEYMFIEAINKVEADCLAIMHTLERYGAEGWELVAVENSFGRSVYWLQKRTDPVEA